MQRQPFTLTDAERAAEPLEVIGNWSHPAVRKPRSNHEDKLQVAVAKAFRVLLPPGVIWWSSESRGVGEVEGARRKARGVIVGTPDMMLMHAGKTVFVELKARNGKLSADQMALHARLRAQGFSVYVLRSIDQVLDMLQSEGIPMRAVR